MAFHQQTTINSIHHASKWNKYVARNFINWRFFRVIWPPWRYLQRPFYQRLLLCKREWNKGPHIKILYIAISLSSTHLSRWEMLFVIRRSVFISIALLSKITAMHQWNKRNYGIYVAGNNGIFRCLGNKLLPVFSPGLLFCSLHSFLSSECPRKIYNANTDQFPEKITACADALWIRLRRNCCERSFVGRAAV